MKSLTRFFRAGCRQQTRYFGLNELDRKLEPYVDFDNGFYVELGANDGINQSNTYSFELFRGWRGVLIEPAPHNFLKCLARRGDRNAVFCNACVDFDYTDRFVEITYANLMSFSRDLESDLPDFDTHLEKSRMHMPEGETSFTFGAVARPLNELLIEAEAPAHIDLLSLDVEGAELSVLRGIDHEQFRFGHMLIECRDLDRVENHLKTFGYAHKALLSQHDHLFVDTRQDKSRN